MLILLEMLHITFISKYLLLGTFLYFDCFLQIPTLIHELLAVELWKEKLFPKLLESGYNPHTTLPVYFAVGVKLLF